MPKYYKILQKAKLSDGLFDPALDEPAWQQAEADREWASTLDADRSLGGPPLLESATRLLAEPGPVALRALGPVTSRTPAPDSEPRPWPAMLAEMTGISALKGIRALGVCALDRGNGATAAAVLLAKWAAQNSEKDVLLVEGHMESPRLADELDAPSAGLLEALSRKEPVEALVQGTREDRLKVLTAGAPMTSGDRATVMEELPDSLSSLKTRYASLIVELPAINSAAFRQMPIGAMADAVILVADSRTASPRALRKAAEALRETKVIFAGTLLDSVQHVRASTRESGARQQWFA
jgi:Mrp family chromosome partitioning ATPase